MATFRQEKDRSSAGTETPVKPQNNNLAGVMGYSDSSVQDRLNQDAIMFRAGYDDAYYRLMPRILELEDLLRWYIKDSVSNMFQDIGFDGAEAARQRSTQRFWSEYRERDAA